MEEIITNGTVTNAYSIILSNYEYKKLFAIQVIPEHKYWFKDKEININEFIKLLENI